MLISQLHGWDKNPRGIKKDDFQRLKNQIKTLGLFKPFIITEDGTVLGGNMRLRACQELGITEVQVTIVKADTEELKIKYALADNDRAGYYEEEQLAELITSLGDINLDDFKVDLGNLTDIKDLLSKFGPNPTEDEAPEVSTEPAISKRGEVYQLGRHRLMCGDSTKIEDVEKLMDGKKADMVFTDPPYGYSYESNYQTKYKELANDDKFLDFIPLAVAFSQDNSAHYICCGWQTVDTWRKMIVDNGLKLKNMIIWKKNNWSMGDLEGAYAGQYETILFAHKGKVTLDNGRDRDVWEFDRVPPTDHPTMKPVGLVARAINNHMSNLVLDLFGGSGSTLIACEQTNRTCYMMELDEHYCDVIRKRYENFVTNKNG